MYILLYILWFPTEFLPFVFGVKSDVGVEVWVVQLGQSRALSLEVNRLVDGRPEDELAVLLFNGRHRRVRRPKQKQIKTYKHKFKVTKI